MMRSEPVLQEHTDIRIWNRLDEIDSLFSSGKTEKAMGNLHSVVEDMSVSINPVHSAVLVRTLGTSMRENIDDIQTVATKIMEKCPLDDTFPALVAAEIHLSCGDTKMARYLLERRETVSDKAYLEYLLGMMALAEGDSAEAELHFLGSYSIDPLFMRSYEHLARLFPDDGWEMMEKIAVLMSGGRPPRAERSFSDTDAESLYRIYWEWFCGDRNAARNMLSISANGDNLPDFSIAAARLSLLDGDVETSLMFYRSIIPATDLQHLWTEAADVLILSGDGEEALSLLHRVEEDDPLNRGMLECRMRALSSPGTAQEAVDCVSAFMRTEHADRDGYESAARAMSSCGRQKEAGRITDVLLSRFPDDTRLLVLRSSIELAAGRITSALEFADEAVKRSSKDPDCRYQRARILTEMGKMKKALRDIDAALSANPRHIPSHSLLKDIRMDQKDYVSVLRICDAILSIDPNNADVMRDKAYALDATGDMEGSLIEYRNALRTRHNQRLFEDVLTRLLSSGRRDEIRDLCDELMDGYGSSSMMWRLKGNSDYACGSYKEAMESFGKAAELSPYEPQIWHSKGMAAEMIGQLKRAEESFDKALLLDLDSKEFWLSKAVIQEKRGNLKGAVLALNRVISESPDSVFALVRKAMILARTEKYDEAIFFIDTALKVNSKDISVHRVKMDVLKHLSWHEPIVRAANDMLLVDPGNVYALTEKTRSHLALGQHRKAASSADRALAAGADSVEMLQMRKTALRALHDHAGVAETCRRILSSGQDDRQTRMELADAMAESGDRKGAMDIYNGLSAEDPTDLRVIAMKSKISSNMGEGSKASEFIQEVLDNKPKDAETLNILADAMMNEGQDDDAILVLDSAIRLSPSDTGSRKMKARLLMKKKDYEEAQKVLTEALREDPDDPQTWRAIGEVQEARRDMRQSLLSYDSAMKLGMDDSEIYFRRGRVQEALGMDEAAINSYSIAAVKDPDGKEALLRTAGLQIKMDRTGAAEQNLDAVLSIDPDDPDALFARARIHMAKGESEQALALYSRFINGNVDGSIADEFCDLVGADVMTVPGNRRAESERRFRDEIELYSHAVLEHCYNTGCAISDRETFTETDVPEGMMNDILRYLGSIEEHGVIDIGSKGFERMEALSRNLVLSERLTRIESEPLVSLSSAYMVSGADGIDESKELVAYIFKVMTEDVEQDIYPDDVVRISEEISSSVGDVTVFGIMEAFDVGVCRAKMSKMLSTRMSESIAFHV